METTRTPPAAAAEPLRTSPLRLALQVGAVALVAALLGLLVWRTVGGGRSTLPADVRAGKRPPAPGFDLAVVWARSATWPSGLVPALADDRLDLRELRGHPVVVNFWASWCGPCRDEAPVLAAAARGASRRVAFLGVDVQDLTEDARRFLVKYRVPYVSTRDGNGGTYDRYGLTGVPETFFLDARGRVVVHVPGPVSREDVARGLRASTGSG